MTFVYVLIEYYGTNFYDIRGAADTQEKAEAWKLSAPHRSYDKWRVK